MDIWIALTVVLMSLGVVVYALGYILYKVYKCKKGK